MQLGYERLYNLGNFEHEKFSISKQEEIESPDMLATKTMELVWFIVELKTEIERFRRIYEKYRNLKRRRDNMRTFTEWKDNDYTNRDRTPEEYEAAMKKINHECFECSQYLVWFKETYKPEEVPYKCPYCRGEVDENEYL